MRVIHSAQTQSTLAPVYGASADVFPGALLMPGVTAETNDGTLIIATDASNADAVGVLVELHDFSESGDALVTGAVDWFNTGAPPIPSHKVQLIDTGVLCRVAYDLVDTLAVTSYSSVTLTIGSLEDNIDTGFIYIASGAGIGQLEFIDTSAAGSCTVPTAFPTVPDSTSTVVKILPLYHQVVKWDISTATDETKIGSDAAAGTGRCFILERHIVRNGYDQMLDPDMHGGLSGLNSLAQFEIYAVLQITNAGFHPID